MGLRLHLGTGRTRRRPGRGQRQRGRRLRRVARPSLPTHWASSSACRWCCADGPRSLPSPPWSSGCSCSRWAGPTPSTSGPTSSRCVLAVYPAARLVDGWFGRWSWIRRRPRRRCDDAPRALGPRGLERGVQRRDPGRLCPGGSTRAARRSYQGPTGGDDPEVAQEQRRTEEAAVREERGRIAREVQDVVAHAVGSMLVQVGAARSSSAVRRNRCRSSCWRPRRRVDEPWPSCGAACFLGNPAALRSNPCPTSRGCPSWYAAFARGAGSAPRTGLPGHPSDRPRGQRVPDPAGVADQRPPSRGSGAGSGVPRAQRRRAGARGLQPVGTRSSPSLPSGGHGLVGVRERVGLFDGALDVRRRDGSFFVRAMLRVPRTDAGPWTGSSGWPHDQRGRGRRPGTRAGRAVRDPGDAARHRGRGGGRGRRRGGERRARAQPRRRPDGRAVARHRRHRGRGPPGRRPVTDPDADDVRPRRARVRGDEGGCLGLPAQGRGARSRSSSLSGRPRAAMPCWRPRSPGGSSRSSSVGRRRARPGPSDSSRSPPGSARCSPRSRTGAPTARSLACCSPRRQP